MILLILSLVVLDGRAARALERDTKSCAQEDEDDGEESERGVVAQGIHDEHVVQRIASEDHAQLRRGLHACGHAGWGGKERQGGSQD